MALNFPQVVIPHFKFKLFSTIKEIEVCLSTQNSERLGGKSSCSIYKKTHKNLFFVFEIKKSHQNINLNKILLPATLCYTTTLRNILHQLTKKKITNNFTSQILSSEKVVKRETLKEEGYNKQQTSLNLFWWRFKEPGGENKFLI